MTRWTWTSERSLMRTFDGEIPEANRRALTLHRLLDGAGFAEVEDAIPGARTLTIVLRPGMEPSDTLVRALEADVVPRADSEGRLHTIAVTYDGADLSDVATRAGMTRERVIASHAAAEYRVAFIGFSPGFPYLIGLPEGLHTPRLATPRVRIPAGSVGIAGGFTGIYPRATPGGWNLIGQTDASLFDPSTAPPATLQPGDRVRFVQA